MSPKLAYTIPEACAAAGIGRTTIYAQIRDAKLRAFKCGRRTLIRADELHRWVDSLSIIQSAE